MANEQDKLSELLSGVLARPSSEACERYLDEACAQDKELREQVNSLLKAHREAGDFLRQSVVMPGGNGAATAEGPGTVIGRYRLSQQIGEGGFGLVFMAEQQVPVRRMVALKILKPGMDNRPGTIIAVVKRNRIVGRVMLEHHAAEVAVMRRNAVLAGPTGLASAGH